MKKTLLSTFSLFAALAAVFLFTTNTAEARGHSHGTSRYVSHYSSCGCPVYVNKVFRYHDRYGRPVYSYYRQPVSHRCSRYSRHHGSRHYQKPSRCRTGHGNYYRNTRSHRYSRHGRCNNYNRSGFSITLRR